MDEINIGPKHDFRSPCRRFMLTAATVALIAAIVTLVVIGSGGRPVPGLQGDAADMAVFTCDQTSTPSSSPRAGDLVVGSLWIINARDSANPPAPGTKLPHEYKYPIGVRPGATVTMMIAPRARGHVVIDNPYAPSEVSAATYRACASGSSPGWSVFVQDFAFIDGRTSGCVPLTVRTGRKAPIRQVTISLNAGRCAALQASTADNRLLARPPESY